MLDAPYTSQSQSDPSDVMSMAICRLDQTRVNGPGHY